MATGDHLSREELFELVWSKPTSEVARELGVSDAAVGKLCRRLQVPKPPRGYWARVAAARTPKKPPLPAFVDESLQGLRGQKERAPGVRLSPRRRELFLEVARMIDAAAEDHRFRIRDGWLQWIEPEFAAAMLFTLQRESERWLRQRSDSAQQRLALERKIEDVSRVLLEHAPGTVTVFTACEKASTWYGLEAVLVRFSPELRQTVARMAQIVRDHGLTHVARGLDRGDCGWRVRYAGDPERFISATTTLYVDAGELWVEATSRMSDAVFRSRRFSLWDVVPEDQLGVRVTELPPVLTVTRFGRRADALRRLLEADQVLEQGLDALRERDMQPDTGETLPEVLKMWLSEDERRALDVTRAAIASVQDRLEEWESALELERMRVAEELLDVRPGDVAVAEVRGRTVRMLVDHVTASLLPDSLLAVVNGRPFRKDGKPGKRQETAYIEIPWEPDRKRVVE